MIAARQIFLGCGARGGGWKNPYITDGLIAMWDGEWNAGPGVHDANAAVWKDLVGGNQISVDGYGNWSDDNGFDFSSRIFLPNYVVQLFKNTVAWTYECAFLDDGKNGFFGAIYQVVNTWRNNNGTMVVTGFFWNNLAVTIIPNAKNSVSVSNTPSEGLYGMNKVYLNGSYDKQHDADRASISAGSAFIGGGYYGITGSARAYSYRFYSRALTADEIAANYAIDKARFNLP